MLSFDFNSVKNHTNDNVSKISSFDSICNQLKNFFNIFFYLSPVIKLDFEKVNNYIKVSTKSKYSMYINYEIDKYQDIAKGVFPYLKYVILDDSIKLVISKGTLSSKVDYIIKEFNSINNIIFINSGELSSNDEIETFNLLLSKNKKLFFNQIPVISKEQLKSLKIFPKISSKYVFCENNSNITDYFISVGLKEYCFYDFYSDEIHIEFPCRVFERSLVHSIYFRNGLKSLDQSIKNDNCKIILNLKFQEDISFLKDMISKLNLTHNWIIK